MKLGQFLAVGGQYRVLELLPELLGAGEADILVSILGLVAGHRDKGPLFTAHDPQVPDGKAAAQGDGGVGQDISAGIDGVNPHIHLQGDGFPLGSGGGFGLGFLRHNRFSSSFLFGSGEGPGAGFQSPQIPVGEFHGPGSVVQMDIRQVLQDQGKRKSAAFLGEAALQFSGGEPAGGGGMDPADSGRAETALPQAVGEFRGLGNRLVVVQAVADFQ